MVRACRDYFTRQSNSYAWANAISTHEAFVPCEQKLGTAGRSQTNTDFFYGTITSVFSSAHLWAAWKLPLETRSTPVRAKR